MATREAAAANRAAAAKRSTRTGSQRSRGRLPLVVAAVVAVCAAVAIGVSVAGDGGTGARDTVEDRASDVSVDGAPLAAYVDGTADLAVGAAFPQHAGTAADGRPLTIAGSDGPMLVVYLAHWCPVCQSEVPVIVDWAEGGSSEGVAVRGVSTAFAPERGNWPTTTWLADEGWDFPTLLDPSGTASLAAGNSAFPFFVAVDAEGEVVARAQGALSRDALDALVAAARG